MTFLVFFCHQDWIGSKYSIDSEPSTIGDKWPKKASMTVGGHIHQEQEVQENLYLTGTPAPMRFGESNDKGIFLFTFFDKKNRTFEKIPLPNTMLRITNEFLVEDRVAMKNFLKNLKKSDLQKNIYRTTVVGSECEMNTFLKTDLCKNFKKIGKYVPKITDTSSDNFHNQMIGEDWTSKRTKKFSEIFFESLMDAERDEFDEIKDELKIIFQN